MDAVTYPDSRVYDFIEKKIVPLQVLYNHQPLSTDFNVKWTPTLVTLDAEGKEHHRTVGFLGPEELIPSLLLGMAKAHFDLEQFDPALANLDALLADYPKSDAAPEAIYLRGVSRYKSTHEPKPLKEAHDLLQAQYPGSEWTKRAYPYRLL
jgi:predicted Zn-dependent protease